jgi:hypothetical protein
LSDADALPLRAERLEQAGEPASDQPFDIDAVSLRKAIQVVMLEPPHHFLGFGLRQSAFGRDHGGGSCRYPIFLTPSKDHQMKLADMDIGELVLALGQERSNWIKLKTEEHRELTQPEKTTVCMLAALEHVLSNIALDAS